jgi:hypothetical protein
MMLLLLRAAGASAFWVTVLLMTAALAFAEVFALVTTLTPAVTP